MKKEQALTFKETVERYHSMVFKTLLGFVHCKEEAEDLTQEVFIKAYKSWHTFRGACEISTWLYRISINTALSHLKKKKRRELISHPLSLFTLSSHCDHEENPEQQLEGKESFQRIIAAINALPEKQRTAFILAKYQELPQRHISEIMQISEGAIEQLLIRAKKNLQKKLASPIGKSNNNRLTL